MRSRRHHLLAVLLVLMAPTGFFARAAEAEQRPETTPPAAPPVAASDDDDRWWTTTGIGPTYFALLPADGKTERTERLGLVLDFASRLDLGDGFGIGLRLAWGLTEFRRFVAATDIGYDIGRWTTNAYGKVWDWASTDDDYHVFRAMGAFFAFMGLLVPYVVAGGFYVIAPFAPTTYLELDVTANYSFSGARSGPYVKGGLGLVGYFHPRHDTFSGGAGPTLGAGLRVGPLDVAANATWLPLYLHDDREDERTHVLIGAITVGIDY